MYPPTFKASLCIRNIPALLYLVLNQIEHVCFLTLVLYFFHLVTWSGTKIQWDGATRKCHLTLFQLQDELQLTFSLGYIYTELVCSFVYQVDYLVSLHVHKELRSSRILSNLSYEVLSRSNKKMYM